MRARTLVAVFSLLFLFAPVRALANSRIIAQQSGVSQPYQTLYGGIINLNAAVSFVSGDTLSDIVIPVSSAFGFGTTTTLYIQLYRPSDQRLLDCKTPVRNSDDLGISHIPSDPLAAMIDFYFSGSECDIPTPNLDGSNEVDARLFYGDGLNYTGFYASASATAGWMGANNLFNFTAYAGGIPPSGPSAAASSVLFLPGTEASRLYVQGPLGREIRAWEPNLPVDVAHLAMNTDGTSVERVYTKDIVDSLYSNGLTPGVLEVYSSLEKYLDTLVAAGTIKEWRPYPYDWRYDPFDIVNNGTLTQMSDGSLQTVYLADVLKEMASRSPTGKVTIVAHSNGGLVAKALALSFSTEASTYIDRIILIGTPQFGTPSAIGSMLHGDGQTYLGGLVMYGGQVREEALNMPGLYTLLPSSAYFSIVGDPVTTFATGTLSSLYANAYGTSIVSTNSLKDFLSDSSNINPQIGGANNTSVPLVLRSDLLDKAAATHEQLDSWAPPAGITLSNIAGWGQKTVSGLAYDTEIGDFTCDRNGLFSIAKCGFGAHLNHTKILTEDGDEVVASPSAIGTTGNYWYFDAQGYQQQRLGNITHIDLTAASPIQNAIQDLLQNGTISESGLVNTKQSTALNPLTIISIKSAHRFTAVDSSSNETGIVPVPGVPDVSYRKEDVPGSSLDISDDWITLYLPESADLTLSTSDFVASQTTLSIGSVNSDGVVGTTTLYPNIPTTSSTKISLNALAGVANSPVVDVYGDGSNVFNLATDTPATLPPVEIISLLQNQIQSLSVRPGIKNRLLRMLGAIESRIDDLGSAQFSIASLEALIEAQAGVGISLQQGASMLQLLNNLGQ